MSFGCAKGDEVFQDKGACAKVRHIELGMLQNNVYFVDDGEGGVIVVDPSSHAKRIEEVCGDAKVSAIFVTHTHFDHVEGLHELQEDTHAPVYASKAAVHDIAHPQPRRGVTQTAPAHVDHALSDGQGFTVGATAWRAIATPGHSPCGMCFYLDPAHAPQKGTPLLISGDTLFCASIGRVDFEGGDPAAMVRSLAKLEKLPSETLVCPGHGELTTIGAERPRVFSQYL